jgi:hypothetical protein
MGEKKSAARIRDDVSIAIFTPVQTQTMRHRQSKYQKEKKERKQERYINVFCGQ